jgi:hypothetical protein
MDEGESEKTGLGVVAAIGADNGALVVGGAVVGGAVAGAEVTGVLTGAAVAVTAGAILRFAGRRNHEKQARCVKRHVSWRPHHIDDNRLVSTVKNKIRTFPRLW